MTPRCQPESASHRCPEALHLDADHDLRHRREERHSREAEREAEPPAEPPAPRLRPALPEEHCGHRDDRDRRDERDAADRAAPHGGTMLHLDAGRDGGSVAFDGIHGPSIA
jgi:hypothetical protein